MTSPIALKSFLMSGCDVDSNVALNLSRTQLMHIKQLFSESAIDGTKVQITGHRSGHSYRSQVRSQVAYVVAVTWAHVATR